MNEKEKDPGIFRAKILLFGEYGVLSNSRALIIPFDKFSGKLTFLSTAGPEEYPDASISNQIIKKYAEYLQNLKRESLLLGDLHLNDLERDIKKELCFVSDIPRSYGVGSSGAFCASIYHRYAKTQTDRYGEINAASIRELRKILSQLESYFHGTSSGTDPLVSYLDHPLLLEENGDIHKIELTLSNVIMDGGIFLIDTGFAGNTQPLVRKYLGQLNDPDFLNMLRNEFIMATNRSIESLINGNRKEFFNALEDISRFQFKYFKPMIPGSFHDIWNDSLKHRKYILKLCGSGGGGFLLAFARDKKQAVEKLRRGGLGFIEI